MKKIMKLVTVISFLALTGCASTKVEYVVQLTNMVGFEKAVIEDVRVYSLEVEAQNNEPLQNKLENWKTYSKSKLEESLQQNQFEVVDSVGVKADKTLLLDLDVKVAYGNRFLRWFGFYGAGKGSVDSTLTIKDSKSKVVYKATAESELYRGFFGGDVGRMLEGNIKYLLKSYQTFNNSTK